MPSKQPKKINTETDIFEILITLWIDKLWIGLAALIGIVLSILYIQYFNITKYSTFTVRSLSIVEILKYEYLNNQFKIIELELNKNLNTHLGRSFELSKESIINRDNFLSLFIGKLREGVVFEKSMIENNYLIISDDESDQEFIKRVRLAVRQIEIKPHVRDSDDYIVDYWDVRVSTEGSDNSEFAQKMIKSAIILANEEVFHSIITKINVLKNTLSQTHSFIVEKVKRTINSAELNYNFSYQSQRLYLQEQEQIARSLEIPKFLKFEINKLNPNLPVVQIQNYPDGKFYYLNGYIAIKKEIEQLDKNFERKKLLDEKITSLKLEKQELDQIELIKTIEKAIENADIKRLNFNSSWNNVGSMKFEPKVGLIFLYVLSGIVGFFAGALIVLISRGFSYRALEQKV